MKILRAQRKLEGYDIREFDINDLRLMPPEKWLNKRINLYEYDKSFELHGMLYPITVSTHHPVWVQERIKRNSKVPHHLDDDGEVIPGLYVHTGNKRVHWAKLNGYDKIEGYLVDDKEEKAQIRSKTHINHDEIPK